MMKFPAELNDLTAFFKEEKITSLTEVQEKAIPELLRGKSVLAMAPTGTGKTFAFAIPAMKIAKKAELEIEKQEYCSPFVLVLTPTRELASQVFSSFKKVGHHIKLKVRLMTAGQSSDRRLNLKREAFQVLIATPQRIKTAVMKKELNLSHLKLLIMDESDQLLDMGFQKDLKAILSQTNYPDLQIGLFSATVPLDLDVLVASLFTATNFERQILTNVQQVSVKLTTFNVMVTPGEKLGMMKMFLEKTAKGRGIIYANQKNQVDEIFAFLKEKMPKLRAERLHGEMTAIEREKIFDNFLDKKYQVLVSSDITARGMDVPDLMWVMNYNLPKSSIYYLHRIGRVARGVAKQGLIYNMVTIKDGKWVRMINEAITQQTLFPLETIKVKGLEVKREKFNPHDKKFKAKQRATRPAAPVQGSRARNSRPSRSK